MHCFVYGNDYLTYTNTPKSALDVYATKKKINNDTQLYAKTSSTVSTILRLS